MAEGGIDRKAEEKMEFTTSKDVTVAPTFQVRPHDMEIVI
jgi:ATP-dependent RNA helicase